MKWQQSYFVLLLSSFLLMSSILQNTNLQQLIIFMSEQKNNKKLPKIVTQVDDFGRKKFALKQHDSQPQEENEGQQKFIDTGRYTSTLIGRQQKIDTDKYIGRLQGTKKKKKTQVFYCEVCQVGFKCDLAYITHVNSPSHNRKLGMNMRVEAVSVETVAQKLARMANQKNKSKHQKIMQKKLGKNWEAGLLAKQQFSTVKQQKANNEQRVNSNGYQNNQIKEKNEEEKDIKKQGKYQQCQVKKEGNEVQEQDQVQSEEDDDDLQMMKQLGLPTQFGSKNKKY